MKTTRFILVTALIAIIPIFIGVSLFLSGDTFKIGESEINTGIVILIIWIIGYLIPSIRSVDISEVAAVLSYGKPIFSCEPGLIIVLLGIFQLKKNSAAEQQFQIPADPEQIFKGKDDEKLPEGMVRPMRIATASPETVDIALLKKFEEKNPDAKKDDLHVRMSLETDLIVRYRIIPETYFKFMRNIVSLEEAARQIRDTSERVLTGEMSKRTVSMILGSRDEIDKSLITEIKKLVGDLPGLSEPEQEKSWGIQILDVQLLQLDITYEVNKALEEKAKADINKKTTVKNAEAQKDADALDGIGKGAKIKSIGTEQNAITIALYEGTTAKTNERDIKVAEHLGNVKTLVMGSTQERALVTIPVTNPV